MNMKTHVKIAALTAALISASPAMAAQLIFDFVGLDPTDNFTSNSKAIQARFSP
jgi:hypothetical protein